MPVNAVISTGPTVHPARASALGNDVTQNLRPEGPIFKLIEGNERPCRPHENFGGIDSKAEGPWLGEPLALRAEKNTDSENLRVKNRPSRIRQ